VKRWWLRCILSALLNALIWVTPPPVHFVSLLLPFFSGYSIASGWEKKGLLPALRIGGVMGLTLGATALAAGGLGSLVVGALLGIGIPFSFGVIFFYVCVAIGCYTAMAATIGALLANRKASKVRTGRNAG